MSLENLNESDIEILRQLLELSGRVAPERREALCIKIGINSRDISAIKEVPTNDFAVLLINDLINKKLENFIYKLCEELKSDFRGGGYAPKLDAIINKLNGNRNFEPDHSISIPESSRENSNELTQPLPHNVVTEATLLRRRTQIYRPLLRGSNLKTLLVASITVTAALIGLRFFGVLEWLELKTFDHYLQFRPDEGIDKRLLIVKITDEDILAQDTRGEKGQGSLRDPSLNQLLEKLEQHKPRLIGLDLYRPFSADKSVPSLLKRLQQKHIVAVCKAPILDEQGNPRKEVAPPKEVSSENISFSDFVSDIDNTVRRHLLVQESIPGAKCRTEQSFSFMLARRYLELELGKNIHYQDPLKSRDNLQLGDIVFHQLQPFTGGYQDVDAFGFQVLLNYRATSFGKLTRELTLEDILNNKFKDQDVRDKIVLVGSAAEQQGPPDRWSTPYGTLNGVTVHAHMISQILSAVLDRRPLLSVWSQGGEILWIWGWSLIGGVLACYWRSFKSLGIAVGCGFVVLYVTCLTSLTVASLWIPFIPPALALISTLSVVTYIASFSRARVKPLDNELDNEL